MSDLKNITEALEEVLSSAKSISNAGKSVKMNIDKGLFKVLKEDIFSPINMPPFNRSRMDGYALSLSEDEMKVGSFETKTFDIVGESAAGSPYISTDKSKKSLEKHEAIKIMTGAIVPECSNTVVPVEWFSDEEMEKVSFVVGTQDKVLKRNSFISYEGEDFAIGEKLIEKGRVVDHLELAVMASVGIHQTMFYSDPTVGIIATGDEVVPFNEEEPLKLGKIRNCNNLIISSILKENNLEGEDLGIVKDDYECLKNAIRSSIEGKDKKDVLVISGGVSMGDYDYIPAILEELGLEIIFHKISLKPGKPLIFAKKENTLVFGMPGNPLSCLVNTHLFVIPALLTLKGYKYKKWPSTFAALEENLHNKHSDRTRIIPAILSEKRGEKRIKLLRQISSGDLRGSMGYNSFAVIEKGRECVKKGEEVEVLMIKGSLNV